MDTPSFFSTSLPINLKFASDGVEAYLEAQLASQALNLIQWYTLRVLYAELEPLTISEVARRVGRKPNSFTHVVRDLVLLGFVVRVPDKTDHRRVWLHLTDQAKANRQAFLMDVSEIEAHLSQMIGNKWESLLQSLITLQMLSKQDDS